MNKNDKTIIFLILILLIILIIDYILSIIFDEVQELVIEEKHVIKVLFLINLFELQDLLQH